MSTLLSGGSNRHAASLAASSQSKSWEQALVVRIALQKGLETANKLPVRLGDGQGDEDDDKEDRHGDNVDADSSAEEARNGLCSTILGLISSLNGALEVQLADGGKGEGKTNRRLSKKPREGEEDGDDDELWEKLQGTQKRLRVGWEETVNKWHARMHFGSEKNKSTMRVFNQTIWEQIDISMADWDRVVDKSRVPLEESPRIGALMSKETRQEIGRGRETDKEAQQSRAYDEEVYDDRSFYSMLLKTFITSSMSASDTASMSARDIEALRKFKKKKNVDRKASKGRKIRYVVHTKLQNFTFPIPSSASAAAATGSFDEDRLFQSLFQ